MAKSIIQNGIAFSNYNNVDVTPIGATVRLGSSEGLDEDNFGIVNAVDIAWNGADLSSAISDTNITEGLPENIATITTTGELLAIKKVQSPMFAN